MLKHVWFVLYISLLFVGNSCKARQDLVKMAVQKQSISVKNYMFWPNATVPFYVNPDHFDKEQSLAILTALSKFAFKTCLKFAPVMAAPTSNEHVLVVENIGGVRRCVYETLGHSVFEPHRMTLGYDCLQSPQIEQAIMRSLGFPFEHTRINRDVYIDVIEENIETGNMDLFTKELIEPIELRAIPYDINSVMHFGPRDFSKNGHRTILFKNPQVQQNRVGLTKLDIRKIDVVYGDECRGRDRQKKRELCQSYPGVARKKRDVDRLTSIREMSRSKRELSSKQPETAKKDQDVEETVNVEVVTKSLRVNPDITPPPNVTDVKDTLSDLGINEAVQNVVEEVYKVSALALKNAREKYCNNSKTNLRTEKTESQPEKSDSDILGIIELIANYAQGMVDNAVTNLTKFCEESESIDIYQRARCSYGMGGRECRQTYKSTKSGAVRYSTQHRPTYIQSTKHGRPHYKRNDLRSGGETDTETTVTEPTRRKRGADDGKDKNIGVEQHNVIKDKNENEEKKEDQDINAKKDKSNEQAQAKVEEKSAAVLRAGTTVGRPAKRIRYAPVRRQAANRGKHRDMDDSSVSIETEKPRKKRRKQKTKETNEEIEEHEEIHNKYESEGKVEKNKEQSYEALAIDVKEQQADSDEKVVTLPKKKIKKVKEVREVEKKVESDEDETTAERPKKKKKKQPRSENAPRIVQLSKKNIDFYKERKWPGGFVIYVIQEDTTYDTNELRSRLKEVNDILKEKTCVRLKELTEDQASNYEDYIVIDNSPDYVTGRVGGRQSFGSIELFRGDQHRQHTAMMVMAMLGFYFEVSRHDRDKYVRVHMRHVRPDKLHHFEKIREDATLPLPYDYNSATQPAWQYWRQLGRSGISTVATYKHQDPDGKIMKSMGQNLQLLSDIDILKINSVYGVKCFHNERSKTKQKNKHKQNKVTTDV